LLDALGVPAGAVAHDSAVIGDALETYASGVISALNASAHRLGFEAGAPLAHALRQIFEEGHDAR
jgi:nucleotidyltransferase/DNA polymerase involved in DNA repair